MKSMCARCSRKKPPGSQRNVVSPWMFFSSEPDQVAFHGPTADEAVEAPQRGVWLRQLWVLGHERFLLFAALLDRRNRGADPRRAIGHVGLSCHAG
jgi:hypothetical protein